MALLFWEGFDSYSSITDFNNISRSNVSIVQEATYNATVESGIGRFGGNGLRVNDTDHSHGQLSFTGTPITDMWIGKAGYIPSGLAYASEGCIINAFNMSGSLNIWDPELMLQVKANGAIYVYTGGEYRYNWTSSSAGGYGYTSLLGNTPPNTFGFNTWYYIETRYKPSSSNVSSDGIVEVWMNNRQVLNLTNVNNRKTNTFSSVVNCILTGTSGGDFAGQGPNLIADDIYVLDTTGPAPWNTRLGDLRIATVVPNADVGPNQGTPSSGNTHYSVVDESVPNLTDFITFSASATDEGEMFSHASLPTSNGNDGILATALIVVGRKTDAGNATLKLSLQTNNARYNSNTQYLTTSNSYFRQEWITNPNTGLQWSNTDWHSANIGFYIV